MYKILFKKQLFELFRSWFFDAKKNKARSKSGTLLMALLFVALIGGVVGGSIAFVAVSVCEPLASAGVQWMYFDLFAMIAVALGMFGSVLNTFSELYLAKDNDLLLSMPIPVSTVVASRVSVTFIMGTVYSAVAFLPAVIVYQLVMGFDIAALVGGLFMQLEISFIVWASACLLGLVVAKISLKVKNSSFAGVAASIIFIGLYYYVYFKAEVIIRDLVANAAVYGAKIKGSAYFLYSWGLNGLGKPLPILLCLAVCLAFAAAIWFMLKGTFMSIATSTPKSKKAKAPRKSQKARSVSRSLLGKEFSLFSSSSLYMLNCGFGVLFVPAAGIMLLIKGNFILSAIPAELAALAEAIPVILVGGACLLASMNDSAAPSVSLEGKSLWLIQSLPLDMWQVIKAKVKVQFLITEIPMIFYCLCVVIVVPMSVAETVMFLLCTLTFPLLSSLFSMMIGIKMPILTWTNEVVPIKQSSSVMIAIFGSWGYGLLLVGGYFLLKTVSAAWYLAAFTAVGAVACALMCRWLKTKGAQILSTL